MVWHCTTTTTTTISRTQSEVDTRPKSAAANGSTIAFRVNWYPESWWRFKHLFLSCI